MPALTAIAAAMQGGTLPSPANAQLIGVGDSRTSTNSENSSEVPFRTAGSTGFIAWALAYCGHRFDYVGNYGVGGDKLANIQTRLNGGTTRGNILTAGPGLAARVCVFLGGVNNVNDAASVTSPLYDDILTRIIDAGYIVIICNELPNSDQSGSGAIHYARRQYLDGWPNTSTTLTAGQKTTYAAKRIIVNTYDAIVDPLVPYYPRAGMFIDGLHMTGKGCRVVGQLIGQVLEQLGRQYGIARRSYLPATAADYILSRAGMTGSTTITATNSESAGAGGANMDGQGGACITGVVPTGWTATRGSTLRTLLNAAQPVSGSQLSVVVSKITDPDGYEGVRFRITGQVGTTGAVYSVGLNNIQTFSQSTIGATNGSQGIADGDKLYAICRLRIPDGGAVGLLGFGPDFNCSSTAYPNANGTYGAMSGNTSAYAQRFDGMPATDVVVMSQPFTVPAGFAAAVEVSKQIQCSWNISFSGGTPIDITVEVSRLGVVKNR